MAIATISAAVADLAACFQAAGIETARLDARLLVAHATGLDANSLLGAGERNLSPAASDRLAKSRQRRLAREPVSRIVGSREFWGLDFVLAPETLDPRPDSETVVQAVLDRRDRFRACAKRRILDLGTGTGCLLLAILSEFEDATGVGVDVAGGAVACARVNAARLGLDRRAEFVVSNWADGVTGEFEIVVANPPYLDARDLTSLAPEVSYDPLRALDGGADGMDAYRAIVPAIAKHLAAGGLAALEIGAAQADAVSRICRDGGLAIEAVVDDLGGHTRCIVAGKA